MSVKGRMLADWQLKQLGYNPKEVTAACLESNCTKENV